VGNQEHINCIESFPDSQELRSMTTNALDALRSAQQQLHEQIETLDAQRDQIDADQGQLKSESSAINNAQRNLERESERLEILASSLQDQKRTVDASLADVSAQKQELEVSVKEFESIKQQWKSEREDHAQVVVLHKKREVALSSAESQLNQLAAEIEPKQESLDKREQELEARSSKLEILACELDERRKMLVTMQTELEHSQQTVSSQREELLARLGSIHEAPASSMPIPHETPHAEIPKDIEEMQAPSVKPKPAASAAADQFRKLRRDAKRRAIGA